MSIGVTGVSIAPELNLSFHKGSLSCFDRLCCCSTPDASSVTLDDQLYIDHKLRVIRWQDKKEVCGIDSTHARLKLIVVDRLHRVSPSPFIDAHAAFEMSSIEWDEPQPIKASDLKRLSKCVAKIKESILQNSTII